MTHMRTAVAALVLGLTLSAMGTQAPAQEPAARKPAGETIVLNIPSQPLGKALNEFARQSGLQVMLYTKAGEGVTAPSVVGSYTPGKALALLLGKTSLRVQWINAHTVAIHAAEEPPATGPENKQVSGEPVAIYLAKGGAGGAVEEMLVEGQREKSAPFSTANLDLTRTQDDVLPFQVYTARDIELSGAPNLEEFLRTRLPQFAVDELTEEINGDAGTSNSSQNRLDFRGWSSSSTTRGASETVILINGRRLPGRFVATINEQSMMLGDFRSIPMGAVARIEVLSSAGSAIYGGNATGGVINIILREDYRGGQLTLNYENPWEGSSPRRSVDLSYGMPVRGGFSLRLVAGLRDSEPLKLGDRADVTVERWRRRVLERDPARLITPLAGNALSTNSNTFVAATPNIRTGNTSASIGLFGNGSANFTSVPDGYRGGQGLQPFLSRQGVWNFALSEGNQDRAGSRQATLGTVGRSTSLSLGVDKSVGERLKLSLDYQYTQGKNIGTGGAKLGSASQFVPLAAPTNPFGVAVQVNYDDPRMEQPGVGLSYTDTAQTFSATLRADLGAWKGFIDASYSENENEGRLRYFYAPLAGWQNSFLSGAFNPFVDMREVAPAAASFYEVFTMKIGDQGNTSTSREIAAKFSGPVHQLPAGPMQLTAGVGASRQGRESGYGRELLVNSRTGEPVPFVQSDYTIGLGLDLPVIPIDRVLRFYNYNAYAELTAPLLSAAQRIPLVKGLEIFGSARLDVARREGYRTNGTAIEYTSRPDTKAFGLRHDVIDGLSLRLSRSVGFRPPLLTETAAALPPTTNSSVLDRRRNNQGVTLLPTQYLTGGNPDILPMTTTSTNFGVIVAPEQIRGLRLSVDYVSSVRDNVIATTSTQQIIDLEAELPGRVQRGAPDGHASGVGPITFVDARNINFRLISSDNVDFTLAHSLENVFGGRLSLTGAASKLLSFKVQSSNTVAAVEQVRRPGATFARSVQWNGNMQLRWERARWSLGWSTRYLDYVLALPADYIVQGSDRADWALEHDALVGYRSPAIRNPRGAQWLLSDTSITFGVKNVFDREPRFWAAAISTGYLGQDSIVGRSLWLQVRRSF